MPRISEINPETAPEAIQKIIADHLADGHALGEFDATGRLVATHPADGVITAVDAGPRSFLRVF